MGAGHRSPPGHKCVRPKLQRDTKAKSRAGNKSSSKVAADMSGTGSASNAYVARIRLLSNGIRLSKQDETVVETISDDRHDWRRATISVRGDATFTVWLGQ